MSGPCPLPKCIQQLGKQSHGPCSPLHSSTPSKWLCGGESACVCVTLTMACDVVCVCVCVILGGEGIDIKRLKREPCGEGKVTHTTHSPPSKGNNNTTSLKIFHSSSCLDESTDMCGGENTHNSPSPSPLPMSLSQNQNATQKHATLKRHTHIHTHT